MGHGAGDPCSQDGPCDAAVAREPEVVSSVNGPTRENAAYLKVRSKAAGTLHDSGPGLSGARSARTNCPRSSREIAGSAGRRH